MKNKIFILISMIVLCNTILSGCVTGGNNTPTVSSSGGVLQLADIDPTTLDPAVSTEVTSAQYIMEIYSGLLKLDKNLEPVADIAQNWDISSDGTVYTFHLRQDVKFQNKKALTANDFKYSWERAANPAAVSRTASGPRGLRAGLVRGLRRVRQAPGRPTRSADRCSSRVESVVSRRRSDFPL